jgi:heptaprenyl diphosphate synthase
MPHHSNKRLEQVALLAAFALFLSTIEYMVPKPLPFIRLGLANLPILVGLFFLGAPHLFLLVFLKVLGQGLVNGTLFSYIFLFSLFGSYASALAMIAVKKLCGRFISAVGISVSGALASNCIQLVLARIFVVGEGAWLIAPPFLGVGLISSLALGIFARRFMAKSSWFALQQEHRQPEGIE